MVSLARRSVLRSSGLLLPLLFWLAGCQSTPQADTKTLFQPTNYQSVPSLPLDVQRVVVLPCAADGTVQEESLLALDEVLLKTLNQTRRFECVPLSREACARYTRLRAIRSVDTLPHDFFPRLTAEFGAQAVLFIDITHYVPYAPLGLGLRAKLVRLDNRSILWAFDEIFASNQPAVANAARRFWQETSPVDTPTNLAASGLQSPTRFAAYVAQATFQTLPQRYR